MSCQKFKSDPHCVGRRHRSATIKIYGDITSKLLISYCPICDWKKLMTVFDYTIQAKGLGSFFGSLGRISAKVGEKLATNVSRNQGGAMEKTSNIATAAATKIPKAALSKLATFSNLKWYLFTILVEG